MRWSTRRRPEPFRRLRSERWSRLAVWRYLILLALVIFLLKFLSSLG
ncbi:MAG: hypothetical protein V3U35_00955 [Candidatus Neomarinimicrobiota bacterium]